MHISNIRDAQWRRTRPQPLTGADTSRKHGFPELLSQLELRNLVAAMVD